MRGVSKRLLCFTDELAELGHSGSQTLQLRLQLRQEQQLLPQVGVLLFQIRFALLVPAHRHRLQSQVQLLLLGLGTQNG